MPPPDRIPISFGTPVNLAQLYREVCLRQGYAACTAEWRWKEVSRTFCLPDTATSASHGYRVYYERFLLDYENAFYAAGQAEPAVARPQRAAADSASDEPARSPRPAKRRAVAGADEPRPWGCAGEPRALLSLLAPARGPALRLAPEQLAGPAAAGRLCAALAPDAPPASHAWALNALLLASAQPARLRLSRLPGLAERLVETAERALQAALPPPAAAASGWPAALAYAAEAGVLAPPPGAAQAQLGVAQAGAAAAVVLRNVARWPENAAALAACAPLPRLAASAARSFSRAAGAGRAAVAPPEAPCGEERRYMTDDLLDCVLCVYPAMQAAARPPAAPPPPPALAASLQESMQQCKQACFYALMTLPGEALFPARPTWGARLMAHLQSEAALARGEPPLTPQMAVSVASNLQRLLRMGDGAAMEAAAAALLRLLEAAGCGEGGAAAARRAAMPHEALVSDLARCAVGEASEEGREQPGPRARAAAAAALAELVRWRPLAAKAAERLSLYAPLLARAVAEGGEIGFFARAVLESRAAAREAGA